MNYEKARTEFGSMIDQKILEKAIEQCKAYGCEGCAYMSVREWELPCCQCARNCKDYWRKADVRE